MCGMFQKNTDLFVHSIDIGSSLSIHLFNLVAVV